MLNEVDLSVILPAHREGRNLAFLLPFLNRVLSGLGASTQVLVVIRGSDPEAQKAADGLAEVVEQRRDGYGGALLTGFSMARGRWVLTMDADLSHPPDFITQLWHARDTAEVLIASRYVPGGSAQMPPVRALLSRVLNLWFARGLALPVRDMSSGFRLYNRRVLDAIQTQTSHFDILQEILVRVYAEGWRVRELPFHYEPRARGTSNARVLPFGVAYAQTFFKLWKLRNSILSADYDDRAFDSAIFPQRYWQRERFRHVLAFVPPGVRTLDVGCGSSRIIGALPPGSIAVDILLRKLRYARRFERHLVQASGFSLPFPDASFRCVVCSQVIEHVPRESPILDELCRVLAPGGRIVLGTPDYGGWQWPFIEAVYARVAPGAYADEHITHYTRDQLVEEIVRRGFELKAERHILRAELIAIFEKTAN